jgi:hypothetical protein
VYWGLPSCAAAVPQRSRRANGRRKSRFMGAK